MSHRLHIYDRVHVDMLTVYHFVAEHSPQAAERTCDLLEKSIQGLTQFPNRYAHAPENEGSHLPVRHLIFGNYRILFTPMETVVLVLAIVHAAQEPLNPADLF